MRKIGVVGTKDGWSSERLADTVSELTKYRLLINMDEVRLDFTSGKACFRNVDLTELDGLIIKKVGARYSPDLLDRLEMLRYLYEKGLRMYSSPVKILRVLDRLSCTVSLQLAGIPMPPTVITEDVVEALDVVDEYGEAVFKPLYTSKARGMIVIKAGKNTRKQIREYRIENPIMYIQKKMELHGRDLGITFLGGEYIGTYARHNSGSSWTTTTEFGGKYEAYDPDEDVIELASKAQRLFDLDFTCVDVVDNETPFVFEVSAFGGFRGILESMNIDAARLYTEYVLKKLSE